MADKKLKYYAIKTKAGMERHLVVDILRNFFCGKVPEIYEDVDIKKPVKEGQSSLRLFGDDRGLCLVEDVIDAKGYIVIGVSDRKNAEYVLKRTRKFSQKLLEWRVGERQVQYLKAGRVAPSKRVINAGEIVVPKTGAFEGEAMRVVDRKGDELTIEVIDSAFKVSVIINVKDVIAE